MSNDSRWRKVHAALKPKTCPTCGRKFKPNSGSQRYCDGCKSVRCKDCGRAFKRYGAHTRCPACRKARGAVGREPAPLGTRRYVGKYVYLKVAADYPNAKTHGWIREHAYVWQEANGRPLQPDEQIHHRNGIRDDNRIENLELWVGNHGIGGRVEDKVSDALAVLRRYRPEVLK